MVRFSGTTTRRAKAWVIESDCPNSGTDGGHPSDRSSPYLVSPDTLRAWQASPDPYRNTMTPDDPRIRIGLAFPLTDATPWTERAAGDPLYLTAMDSGDPYFTSYTPHNSNVFSFHDDWQDPRLAGTPGQDSAVTPATRSLYCGTALTIPWDPDPQAAPPVPDRLETIKDSGALNLAIANTTEDAFTALAGRSLHAASASPSAADLQLLRTFLHNVLDLADEKGGDARVGRHTHDASFGASAGGHHWTVTPPPADSTTADPTTAGTTTGEETADPASTPAPFTPPPWLATLNDDQHRLDEQLGELYTPAVAAERPVAEERPGRRAVHPSRRRTGLRPDAAGTGPRAGGFARPHGTRHDRPGAGPGREGPPARPQPPLRGRPRRVPRRDQRLRRSTRAHRGRHAQGRPPAPRGAPAAGIVMVPEQPVLELIWCSWLSCPSR
ncbi:hypothetical protein ACIBI9_67590 [Nonomuraea sp. NPDC050451]|uniref:hypothetical protein n=1 Tax=Nonomuraea sp. NPDC050451 TaxID=3364364 RepID=UPI0037A56967